MAVVRSSLLLAGASLAVLLGVSAPASSEERTCIGSTGAVTLDNVRVPPGATCRLTGTRAKGTIKIERTGTLIAANVVVIGNVQGENARSVSLSNTRVGGSVQMKQGGAVLVADSFVDGSIQLESNNAAQRVLRNSVGSDIQAFQNIGGVEIRSNKVKGNLQCKSNSPAPIGGANVVQGNKEDQCRRL
jgi:hypothetical protein